jgi:hypothetical protein
MRFTRVNNTRTYPESNTSFSQSILTHPEVTNDRCFGDGNCLAVPDLQSREDYRADLYWRFDPRISRIEYRNRVGSGLNLLLNQQEIIMQVNESYITDAIEMVESWDLPDEDFADALNAQARLMVGIPSDDYWTADSDTPTQ